MAHKRPGQFRPSPQWWKHLKDWKRRFWHRERQALRRYLLDELKGRDER